MAFPNSHVRAYLPAALAFLVGIANPAEAEIYRWVDEQGNTHYSDTPRAEDQTPAKLPAIRKENLEKRIEFLKDNTPPSCSARGGVDCSAGADTADGSVICSDGWKGSQQHYNELCSSAKLETSFLVEFKEEPLLRPHDEVYKRLLQIDPREPQAYVVEVRNLSDVEATGVEVYFKVPFHLPRKLPASGPPTIPPYGVASYRIPFEELPQKATPRHFAETKMRIQCTNCRTIRSAR